MGKCWDTKQINDFIEVFKHAAHNYMEGLGYLHLGYERYKTNETFVGGGAEKTKEFIGMRQSEFNRLQYELSKEMVKRYVNLDETFKTMVDPAADAKIDTDVVGHIRTHFQRQLEEYETLAFAIQRRTMEDVDKFRKYCGDIEEVYVRNALAQYEELCGTGGFLYNCIKKVEEFDDEACNHLHRSELKNNIHEQIAEMLDTAAKLDSINSKAIDIDKQTLNLVPLSTSAIGVTAYNPALLAANSIKLVSPRDTTKTPRRWSLVKKKFSIDIVRSNAAVNNAKYIESMKEIYGFSQEEAELLNEAYLKHCENSEGIEKMSNRERANSFYTALSCLFTQYSSDSFQFKLMGNNKLSPTEAVSYFDSIGVDGKRLCKVVNNQHSSCAKKEKRDFIHECAIYSVMANDNAVTIVTSTDDNVGDLVGFKGDVYSGSMGMDDVRSDIAAYNIYYRMKRCEDGDVWNAMVEYNIDTCQGSTNESKEFLENMGYGNAEIGMSVLQTKLNSNTALAQTITLIAGRHADVDVFAIERERTKFLKYVSNESGISYK
ncbi:MAG: hypothetical protein IKQ00_03330 [Butyrivibrio sp.]|nr:hypothetical protein [Butyrivibrio sp.]